MNVKYRTHRGGVYYTPENTIPAFLDAIKKGFSYIETDPQFTKDGKIVLIHDYTLNRTCRNKDGSEIASEINVEDLTYDELSEYDAGIFMGEEFRGTKIPLLEELFEAVKGHDIIVALDKKIKNNELEPLFNLVEKYNAKVSFSVCDIERTKKILERFPDAMIDYDGNTTEEQLKEITSLVPYDNLIVWMYMDNPNFAWLTDRMKASSENCKRVKEYARLGLANVNNAYDVFEAMAFNPDVIEV